MSIQMTSIFLENDQKEGWESTGCTEYALELGWGICEVNCTVLANREQDSTMDINQQKMAEEKDVDH